MEVNNRFIVSHYSNIENEEKPTITGINSPEFSRLCLKSQQTLQDRLNNKDLQEVLKNKSVSMMFLDKISKLIGKHHPNRLETRMFMEGASSFASMELIHHLTLLKNNPLLSGKIVQNLEKWILSEQASLPIALIFDTWSATHEELLIRSTSKGDFPPIPITHTIEPPADDVEIFSNALAAEMKFMKAGNKFKIPAGSLQHITRLEFIKNANGTFDIIHFNTGLGALSIANKKSTACKYDSVSAEKLEDPLFWKQFVEVKMQGNMTLLNELLKNLNVKNPPIDLNQWLKKPLQESDSCSFHAAEAEFKHSFITSFASLEKGWEAYKLCTSLMAQNAVQYESLFLEPTIAKILISKEKVRHRYLDWITDSTNLKNAKIAYIQALSEIGPYSEEENEALIKDLSPLMAQSALDKRLNESLDCISFEHLMKIINKYSNAISHIGYKQLQWLESTREIFRDVTEFSGWKGELLLKIREISSILLPMKLNTEVQTKLNYAHLVKTDILTLLTAYLMREETTASHSLLQTLIKKSIVPENFLYDQDVVYSHIENSVRSDPEKAFLLSQHLSNEKLLSNTHKLFLKMSHFEKAYELGEQSKNPLILHDTITYYARNNQIEKAISIIKRDPEMDFTRILTHLVSELCDEGLIDTAVKLIDLISHEENIEIILQTLSFQLAKQGRIEEAIHKLQSIPSFEIKVLKNLIVNTYYHHALEFISHMSKECYQEDAFQDLVNCYPLKNGASFIEMIPDGPLKKSMLEYNTQFEEFIIDEDLIKFFTDPSNLRLLKK